MSLHACNICYEKLVQQHDNANNNADSLPVFVGLHFTDPNTLNGRVIFASVHICVQHNGITTAQGICGGTIRMQYL